MIPIRDTIQARNYPIVNMTLIGVNVLIFLVQLSQGPLFNRFVFTYGLVPARYSVPELGAYFSLGQQVLALFSYMFLHGGFWHLLGNMWFLYIFGDNVEDRLGPFRYLFFYLLCGLASGLSHLFLNWHSHAPTIGASGAIAGVMGAYFILYPRAKVLTLIPIIIIPFFIEIPAVFFLGIWFFLQFISATGSQAAGGGVAWWAHVGGFVFGILFLKLFLRIPALGITGLLQKTTPERKTPNLQVLRTTGTPEAPHLYGILRLTPREARDGTRKLVNLPWGTHQRLLRVTVPPKTNEGMILRLTGMGKQTASSHRGDLFLKVAFESWT